MKTEPKSAEASRLRQKNFTAPRTLKAPEDSLPGSLTLCHCRRGKPTCHRSKEKVHLVRILTYALDGKQKIERIANKWVEEVQRQVYARRQFQEAIAEVPAPSKGVLWVAHRRSCAPLTWQRGRSRELQLGHSLAIEDQALRVGLPRPSAGRQLAKSHRFDKHLGN